MTVYEYSYTKEIQGFNLDHYVPHLGWIMASTGTLKIYSKRSCPFFYLHDERHCRLFEFAVSPRVSLNSKEDYNSVIRAYLETYPENVK